MDASRSGSGSGGADEDDFAVRTRPMKRIFETLCGRAAAHDPEQQESHLNIPRYVDDPYGEIMVEIQGLRDTLTDHLKRNGQPPGDGEPGYAEYMRVSGMADRLREMAYGLQIAQQSAQSFWVAREEVRLILRDAMDLTGGAVGGGEPELPHFLKTRRLTGIEGDVKKVKDFGRLIMYIQYRLRTSGYRRYGEMVYERVTNSANVPTIAWRSVSALSDYVYAQCSKAVNPDMWLIGPAQPLDVVASVVRYFTRSNDPDFPAITKKKSVFSFDNGVYDAERNEFHAYPLAADHAMMDSRAPAPAKHFGRLEFPVEEWARAPGREGVSRWREVRTPVFDSLFEYQEIPRDAIDMMNVTVGRMMHEVGDKDKLGYVGMIVGAAGNGKSTFCNHITKMYEPEDVGVLSNNCERKFALWAFVDKFLFIAPEVKTDFKLDQAEWQGITTGDPMSIAGKFVKATRVTWKVPAFFAGNQLPNWVDHGGSILRRLLLWKFYNLVATENPNLDRELEAELPLQILKSACAYLDMLREHGGGALWNWVPEYFKATRRELTSIINPLQNFLDSDVVVREEGAALPLEEFKRELNRFCKDAGFHHYKMNNDTYHSIFRENGLVVEDAHLYRNPTTGAARRLRCVVGCRMRDEFRDDGGEEGEEDD